jgi:nucleotide-binding universal stress UspA family protein
MSYRKIVMPLDGSELAECVFPHLEALVPDRQSTSIDLVRVVPPIEMHYKAAVPFDTRQEKEMNQAAVKEATDYLQTVKARLSSAGFNVEIKILSGRPADVLADYLKKSNADLLLIATHGRSGPSRWVWGSIAEKLLQASHVPVFLVRPDVCVPGYTPAPLPANK